MLLLTCYFRNYKGIVNQRSKPVYDESDNDDDDAYYNQDE